MRPAAVEATNQLLIAAIGNIVIDFSYPGRGEVSMNLSSACPTATATELNDSRSNHVLPRFQEFIHGLERPRWTIPDDFLNPYYFKEKNGQKARRRNPLLRFLRGETSQSISAIGIIQLLQRSNPRARKQLGRTIIRPYFQYWEKLFSALDNFYNKTCHELTHAKNAFYMATGGEWDLDTEYGQEMAIRIQTPRYTDLFNDFAKAFGALPRRRAMPTTNTTGSTKSRKIELTKVAKAAAIIAVKEVDGIRDGYKSTLGGGKRGRKAPTGIELDIPKAILDYQSRHPSKSLRECVYYLYNQTAAWKANGWMNRSGNRLAFPCKANEPTNDKAIARLYAATVRLAAREKKIQNDNDKS